MQIEQIPLSKEEIQKVPASMGVYFFKKKNTILYIGKSVNLKARLLSHLENAVLDAKEAAIVHGSDHIEYTLTDSEFKALLLESQLIQQHRPQYNARWRDDKSYLYICITAGDQYPKIYQSRQRDLKDKKNKYFGPFPSNKSVQEILREIRKVFPFCTQKRLSKYPCFYSKIHLCNPCPNEIEQTEDMDEKKLLKKIYRSNIRRVIYVLNGKTELVLKNLYAELKELTAQERYEEALELRNKIKRFEYFIQERLFSGDQPTFNQSEESVEALKKLLTPFFVETRLIESLHRLHRIECYDISNLSFKEATASMVVLIDGLIDKSQYRRFKIKNKDAISDFEMMAEIFQRRFRNKKSNIKNQTQWENPDLIVVDGGKPQVRIVQKVLHDLQIDIPLIGIAKHPDRFIIGDEHMSFLKPSVHNPGFNMIRGLRDEAHRFAKKYHVLLRNKKLML
jgi:excinuclease ABC subunit C